MARKTNGSVMKSYRMLPATLAELKGIAAVLARERGSPVTEVDALRWAVREAARKKLEPEMAMTEYIADASEIGAAAAQALLDSLPQSTRAAIDAALRAGVSSAEIVRRVAAHSGDRRSLVTLAVEQYLHGR